MQWVIPATVSILLGRQGAGWTQSSTVDSGLSPSWVVAADFNADGIMDIAVVVRDEDSIMVALGRGAGVFAPGVTYETSQVLGDRRFNPIVIHATPPDGGRRDYDLIYNATTAGVGDWLTDELEYNAWQDAVSPILRTLHPDRIGCGLGGR